MVGKYAYYKPALTLAACLSLARGGGVNYENSLQCSARAQRLSCGSGLTCLLPSSGRHRDGGALRLCWCALFRVPTCVMAEGGGLQDDELYLPRSKRHGAMGRGGGRTGVSAISSYVLCA